MNAVLVVYVKMLLVKITEFVITGEFYVLLNFMRQDIHLGVVSESVRSLSSVAVTAKGCKVFEGG